MALFRLIDEEREAVLNQEAAAKKLSLLLDMAREANTDPQDYVCPLTYIGSYQELLEECEQNNEKAEIARIKLKRELCAILAEGE